MAPSPRPAAEPSLSAPVPFTLDGEPLRGQEGDTLAAALLRAGVTTFTRSSKYHRPRGPFCLAGHCGQCLVRVDGVPSLPACRVPLAAGLACERQNAPVGSVDTDLLRSVDFLFPAGLDHHHLAIRSRLLGRVTLEVARRLAGLGELPDRPAGPRPGLLRTVPLVVVGAGPAGLAAAAAAARVPADPLSADPAVLLVERGEEQGGAARWGLASRTSPDGLRVFRRSLEVPARAGGGIELLLGAEAIALHEDDASQGPALLVLRTRDALVAVRARRVVVATGGCSQGLPFPGSDRPGVFAARGLLELARRTGLLVGKPPHRLVLAGEGEELVDCARALQDAGYPAPAAIDLASARRLRARGNPVSELSVELQGRPSRLPCDALALALRAAPLHELASGVGARTRYTPAAGGFRVLRDAAGRTATSWLFAAGTVAGEGGPLAIASGESAGAAAGAEARAPPPLPSAAGPAG